MQQHQLRKQVQVAEVSFTSILLYGCETWTLLAYSWKKDPGFRNQVPEETSPHLLLGVQSQRLGAELDQHPCGSIGTSSDNCQETETCLVRACHTPRQPPQNHPSGHLRGWSAEEMLNEQHQKVDIPAHTRTVHSGLLQETLEENLCWIVCHVPPTTQSVKGLTWTSPSSSSSSSSSFCSSSCSSPLLRLCLPAPLLPLLVLVNSHLVNLQPCQTN